MDPKFMTILTLTLALLISSSTSTLLSELQTLRSRSDSGVIHLTDESITRFVLNSPTPRPYSLFVFFDATQLRNKPELHLPHLRSEFALVSHSASGSDDIFFCDIEFGESSHSFQLFGVNSLPHIRYISPTVRSLKDSEPMDQSGFAEGAESMVRFVENKGRVSVGPIERPPPISKKQIGFLLLVLLVSAPYLIKRVLAGETLVHDWRLWMFMAIFVYFFSVGGNMHNIIRKMPMVLQDRNNPGKTVYFYQGSGMQLGAEGFAVGFLYTIVGVVLAFVTHILVRVRNVGVQRGVMLVAMVVGYWAVKKVVSLDNWKTGYSIHAFFPSGWI